MFAEVMWDSGGKAKESSKFPATINEADKITTNQYTQHPQKKKKKVDSKGEK